MSVSLPNTFLFWIFAGWLNRQQQAVIDYLRTENEVLKRQLNGRRQKLTDKERCRLAVKGKASERKLLAKVTCIVTPETILRWHRRLIVMKWMYPRRGVGRPPVEFAVQRLIVEMAQRESRWGYTSIRDRLLNFGYRVSRGTVAKVLKEHELEPAPKRSRGTSWMTFLKAHWSGVAAMDFTTVEVWTKGGLVTHYILFVMELAIRKVSCVGITPSPDSMWISQIGRNLTDAFCGFLKEKRFIIMDRDASFHAAFRLLLEQSGVRVIRTPPSSPNCNAHIERFHRSFKTEVAERMIFFGEAHLR